MAPFQTVQERCKNAEEQCGNSAGLVNGLQWQNGFTGTFFADEVTWRECRAEGAFTRGKHAYIFCHVCDQYHAREEECRKGATCLMNGVGATGGTVLFCLLLPELAPELELVDSSPREDRNEEPPEESTGAGGIA